MKKELGIALLLLGVASAAWTAEGQQLCHYGGCVGNFRIAKATSTHAQDITLQAEGNGWGRGTFTLFNEKGSLLATKTSNARVENGQATFRTNLKADMKKGYVLRFSVDAADWIGMGRPTAVFYQPGGFGNPATVGFAEKPKPKPDCSHSVLPYCITPIGVGVHE